MRWQTRFVTLVVGAVLIGLPGRVRAQGPMQMPNIGAPVGLPGNLSSPTGTGSLSTSPGQVLGTDQQQQQAPPDRGLSVTDSFVSIIDGAAPRNMFILRFDAGYDMRQPTRAEYFHPKGGVPNGPGFPFIETRMDYQELSTHAEYALTPWFAMFAEVPYRWLNPEVNRNEHGFSDAKFGFKVCTWSSDNMIASFLLRLYQPLANPRTLGNGHWSIEPGLLASWRLSDKILLEGEFRYWTAIGGSDFAGDLIRYGLGVSYGQRNPGGIWYMPVVECVGWTILSGQTLIASAPDTFVVQDARHQTILNAYLGMRVGYGPNFDFYLGYGRSFTGDFWQRDFYRAELRICY